MPESPREIAALEELADETEARAARVWDHAADARRRAENDAAQGDQVAADLHLREAKAHEDAARVIAGTAALYRQRIRAQRNDPPPPAVP